MPQQPPKIAGSPKPGTYTITFAVADEHGPGDYRMQLASDCDINDLTALTPVIRAIQEFIGVDQERRACPEAS